MHSEALHGIGQCVSFITELSVLLKRYYDVLNQMLHVNQGKMELCFKRGLNLIKSMLFLPMDCVVPTDHLWGFLVLRSPLPF